MKHLDLPDAIEAVSSKQAMEILGISRTTYQDLKQCLNIQKPRGWDFLSNQRGVTRKQLHAIATLKVLVDKLGRRAAQRQINSILEKQHHG